MSKRIAWVALLLVVSGVAMADVGTPPKANKPTTSTTAPQSSRVDSVAGSGKHEEIHRFFKSFADSLKKGDAKTVASHFASNGLHVNRNSGLRTASREAIEQLYADVFRPDRVKAVDISLEDVRQVTPDVVSIEATASITPNDGPPVRTALTAVIAKRDGKWQLDTLHESQESAARSFDGLQALSFLIGDWRDEESKQQIRTKCEWSDDHSFITRSYSVVENGKSVHEGTQKIGFEAVDGVIRSWSFEHDGSFGEGRWTFDGERWSVKLHGRTPTGLNVTATQIIVPQSADSYTTQLVSREVGGKLLPNGPVVKVVRVQK